jgi:neurofibromin 1
MCTRLLSNVAKIQGYNYLRLVLTPLLEEMTRYPMDRDFQLDPEKAKQSEVDANINNIKRLAQLFLDVITNSASVLPV